MDEGEARSVFRRSFLAGDLRERSPIPLGEERVAVDVEIDLGQHELVGKRQRRCIDLGAADDEDTFDISKRLECLLHGSGTLRARRGPRAVARDDDVASVGQRPEALGQGLPGLPPHHDGVTGRERFEVCDVLGDAPRNPSIAPDHAAARDCGDKSDGHTATGARIAGWCW